MKKILIFLLSFIPLALTSCNKKSSIQKKESDISQLISRTFKEEIFLEDQRVTSIKSIAPELHGLFEEHMKTKNIPGIAYGLVIDDSLVLSSATGLAEIEDKVPVSTKTSFRIASMTKSFTAMAILKLRDEGKLSLKDPVVQYIPEIESLEYLTTDSPIINIENLLTMTAGLPEDNPWGDRQLEISTKSFLEIISKGLSLSKVPSYQFEYSNTGYAMLGHIVSKVSGIPYQLYIKEKILIPLGMNSTYWEYTDVPKEQLAIGYRWEDEDWKKEPILHDGAYGAMGGLITSIEDFSKYVSFHLEAWPPRSTIDQGPLKRSSVREMHRPQYNFLNTWNKDWNNEPCARMIGYGYGLGISMDCKRIQRVSHGGALPGYGSTYTFYPQYGIGIMAFGNLTYTRTIPNDKIEKLLFEKLDLKARKLPASNILVKKREEIIALFADGRVHFDDNIFAENFFLDESKKRRKEEIQKVLDKAGAIINIGKMNARNQLRGDFILEGDKGNVEVFFTLSPEKNPKIQHLDVNYASKDTE
ncbi:serine hydrolase domain-containing protein [Eudoraea chungangensis]|uniref:serine hydrolase domain-containing protein n=1 Tax=Eudoraea chungangensis TaxID=1481905 RepID=UPI0023EB36CF|nr:serine hydrolase domain-containing protein [Eudoraea chungangensis]